MKQKRIRKYFWLSIAATISAYFSIIFSISVIIGHLITHWVMWKFHNNGKIKSVILNIGPQRIHLHHWMMGTFALFSILLIKPFGGYHTILLGLISGIITEDFEDVYKPVARWVRRRIKK